MSAGESGIRWFALLLNVRLELNMRKQPPLEKLCARYCLELLAIDGFFSGCLCCTRGAIPMGGSPDS